MSDRDYMRVDWGGQPRNPFWAKDPGTKVLLIALPLVHVLMVFLHRASPDAHRALRNLLELNPEFVLHRFWIWQLVTGGLLHADMWHLLWNWITIFFFGRMVEQRLGFRRFLVFALAANICASLGYLAWSVVLDSVTPALGASGAAMGMITLAALWYPRVTVLLWVIPMQLWFLATFLVFWDLIGALERTGGIAHSAHLGGALYGFFYFRYASRMGGVFGAIDRYVDQKKRKRAMRTRRKEQDMREELDRILDKVNREGMSALSDGERRFLKDASDRLRG